MELSPALQTFVAESNELLEQLEQSLLQLESQPDDRDLLDAIFRAAHTIKGSAGMFGFEAIVAFTHRVESLLDRLRAGDLNLTPPLCALLLRCGDHIKSLVGPAIEETPLEEAVVTLGSELSAALDYVLEGGAAALSPRSSTHDALADDVAAFLGNGDAPPPPAPSEDLAAFLASEMAADAAEAMAGEETSGDDFWRISLRFGPDVLRSGMDPLSFLRYLTTLGDLVRVRTGYSRLPAPTDMDPESCYLDFDIDFDSAADKPAIESVFEFVRDDCQIRIVPPGRAVSALVADIESMPPEDTNKLGEILIAAKAVTSTELASALAAQETERAPEGESRPLGRILVDDAAVPEPVLEAALDRQAQSRAAKAQESRLIRVDADKLDQLINLVGELVIAGSGTHAVALRAHLPEVGESAAALLRLVEQVRDSALGLRMVSIGPTFQRFQRVVRDVSRELGKQIELAISGGETELDKSVVERIGDPLMHLVRNAMDHGIEAQDVRLARGKSARAEVSLNAYHDSGSIVIEVKDDGGGLNLEKIRARALERGLLAPGANPTAQELRQMIFEPGFSTADAISNLSGRGVGMDVVRRNIESLRGTIEIDSEAGRGTVVRIRLPLTLAIIDGFMVGLGEARYVLPLDVVVECLELSAEDGQAVTEQGFINVRGEVLPVLRLREVFQLEGGPGRRENIVVVRFGGVKAGLAVDELLGELQTVIKPLGKLFSYLQGISGSTILGSGEVALILDVPGLIKRVEIARPAGHVAA